MRQESSALREEWSLLRRMDGNLIALDARTGKELWHYQTGTQILSSPISFSVDGKQMVTISTSSSLVTFALP